MATLENSTDGDQENMLTPSKGDSHPVLNDTTAPMMFCNLTPCQFGISVKSFTPVSSLPNHKDKSRLAQLKARRRSSVGVRGSPETNSLIRFMAQQRMKTPPGSRTPEMNIETYFQRQKRAHLEEEQTQPGTEPVRSEPLLPRINATLRQKMASFQSLMDVEESVICDPVPKQDSNTGGCIKTRDYLSDGNSPSEGKENLPPKTPPSKRRCLGPLQGCEMEFREAPTPPFSLKEQEEKEETGTLTSSETVHEAHAVLISQNRHDDFEILAGSGRLLMQATRENTMFRNVTDRVFELRSPGQTPPGEASAASPSLPFSHFSLPSLQEVKPPDTERTLDLQPLTLDTAFHEESLSNSLTEIEASLCTPSLTDAEDELSSLPEEEKQPEDTAFHEESLSNSLTEIEASLCTPSLTDAEDELSSLPEEEKQPEDTAFHEESLSNSLTEIEASLCTPSLTDAEDELSSLPEEEKQPEAEPEAPTKSRNRRKKQPAAAGSEAPCRSTRKKRKQPEEMEPAMRPTRSAAKAAVGKMKCILSPQVATRQWSKDVDRSRYGCRVHVCKNPNLSPIAEKPSPPRLTPAVQQDPPHSCTAPNHETHLNPEFSNDTQATVDLTNVLEDPSEDAVTSSPPSCKESAIGKSRKASVQRERSSGPKKIKVSCAEDFLLINQTEGTTEELRDDQHTTNQEASRETPVPEEQVDAEQNLHTAAQTPCTDSEGKLENHGSVDAPNSGGGSHKTLTVQRKTSRGRKSSRNICVKMKQAEPLQTLPDEEAQEQEDNIRSSSDSQEEVEGGVVGLAPVNLAPAPVNLAPVNLAPVNPAPLHPAPVNPAPLHPAPLHLDPVNPAPVNLAPWQDYLLFEDVIFRLQSHGIELLWVNIYWLWIDGDFWGGGCNDSGVARTHSLGEWGAASAMEAYKCTSQHSETLLGSSEGGGGGFRGISGSTRGVWLDFFKLHFTFQLLSVPLDPIRGG
ncbi:hypothetical protein JOQ06_011825, partial [Pogonophryne albipinna]